VDGLGQRLGVGQRAAHHPDGIAVQMPQIGARPREQGNLVAAIRQDLREPSAQEAARAGNECAHVTPVYSVV